MNAAAGGGEPGADVQRPARVGPLRGVRVLVYVVLATFAVFSAAYSWHNVVRLRAVHLAHLADLAAAGAGAVVAERLRQLGEVPVSGRDDFVRGHAGWAALAVRPARGILHALRGPRPPAAVRRARCARADGCVALLAPAPDAKAGGGYLWLVRTVGERVVYGGLPLVALDRLWSRFPRRAADRFDLRGPRGAVVGVRGGEADPQLRVWRPVGGSGLVLGVGASGASLRAEWWSIVWPGALFFALVAVASEAALRAFARRAARAAAAVAAGQARVRRARDLYAALSDTNQLIVRHPEPEALFAATCRLLVERAGVWAARIGWVEPAPARPGVPDPGAPPIRWVAWAARGGESEPEVHCRPAPEAMVRVVEAGRADFAPGSRECGGSGFCRPPGSQGTFAIRRGGHTAAVLWLCAAPGTLEDRDERALLEELVLDLGFSLEDTAQRRRLEHAATHDPLTDLANRRRLAQALQAAHAAGGRGVLVAFYLDGLREVNAALGHAAGDELLREAARRLRGLAAEQAGALAARGDGDRLYLLLPGLDSAAGERFAAEVQAALAAPVALREGEEVRLEVIAGGAYWPEHWNGAAGLIARAELALEAARRRGPGARIGFEPEMEDAVHRARRVRREFEPALARGALTLHYQPVLSLATGAVEGVEALVRWIGPDGAVRAPGSFLPQVEQDPRLLRALGRFVLREALARVAAWSATGLAVDVAVNIGASHLSDPAFVADLDEVLAGREPLARRLLIEITESAYLDAREAAAAALEAVRARGVRVALDDFGTAYASLSYLQTLPVDRIKIDRSFTARLLQGRREEAIVGGVVLTARLLGLDLVAEGVEMDSQAELLRHLGCPKLQGYRIARPMPADAAAAWLRAWDPAPWAQGGGAMTPLLDRAEVLTLAIQDWVSVRSLLRAARGEADPPECCPWLRAIDAPSLFARWLSGPGRARFGGEPSFEALTAEQAELAAAARAMAARLDAGGRAGLEDAAAALVARGDGLLERLQTLPPVPAAPV